MKEDIVEEISNKKKYVVDIHKILEEDKLYDDKSVLDEKLVNETEYEFQERLKACDPRINRGIINGNLLEL